MLVKDLILAHTAEEIYSIYNPIYNGTKLSNEESENLRNRFFKLYDNIRTIKPIISVDIVLGCPNTNHGLEYVETIFINEDAANWQFQHDDSLDLLSPKKVKEFNPDFILKIISDSAVSFPTEYDITELSRAKVLGFEIPEENLHVVGELQMSARLMFDLGILTLSEEDTETNKNIEDEEVDFQEMMSRLSPDDLSLDKRSAEYNAEDDKPLFVEELLNLLSKYNTIKEYFGKQR